MNAIARRVSDRTRIEAGVILNYAGMRCNYAMNSNGRVPQVSSLGNDILGSAEEGTVTKPAFFAGFLNEECGSENHRQWQRQMRLESERIFDELFQGLESDPFHG